MANKEPSFNDLPWPMQLFIVLLIAGVLIYAFILQPLIAWFQQNWFSIVLGIILIIFFALIIWNEFRKRGKKKVAEEENKRTKFEEEQKVKGLVRWVRPHSTEEKWGTAQEVKKWQRESEEDEKKRQEIERSILIKKLTKNRSKELEGLDEEEKEYQINKWIKEEYEWDGEGYVAYTTASPITEEKPKIEKVSPLSQSQIAELIRKVGNRCCYPNCKETLALDVHHIKPRAEGGSNKENNLIVLCPTHHRYARDGTISRERLRQYSVANVKKVR